MEDCKQLIGGALLFLGITALPLGAAYLEDPKGFTATPTGPANGYQQPRLS